jgi:uncharacterized protein GlcG (DUF336 family)
MVTHMLKSLAGACAVLACSSVVTAQGAAPKLSLTDALQLIETAEKEATAKNYRLSFAVVDARGDLVALVRMPGANPITADTAIGKAMLSAFFGQPSGALSRLAQSPIGQGLNEQSGGRLRFFQGALPIVRGGFTVGAIAASGASAQQDEDTVRVAVAPASER